ncbi:MAG: DUF4381 domain-containing protein [Gammaproteobacteria bacterium]|nr:MAG: DUF4381 domain-containing protein [Gammaproteobacteria bacterium]
MPLPLEDIILPPPPGSWPWAPGIWMLVIGAILCMLWGLRALARKWPFWRARGAVIRHIRDKQPPPAQLNRALHAFACRWLRAPAALSGQDWVDWMIAHAPGLPPETSGALEALAESPYAGVPADPQLNRAALLWLKRVQP